MQKSDQDADYVPMPMVLIDQDSDSDATIVQLSFGDRLGALIDTMKALKDLGLDVSKGTVSTEGSVKQTKFFITRLDTGRKVDDPDMLERIRLTIINNLLKYHPESSVQLAMGEAFGIIAPEKKLDVDIATHIQVKEDGPKRSLLCIETADRPGLLRDSIKQFPVSEVYSDCEEGAIRTKYEEPDNSKAGRDEPGRTRSSKGAVGGINATCVIRTKYEEPDNSKAGRDEPGRTRSSRGAVGGIKATRVCYQAYPNIRVKGR
ncbi:hypothetical protein FH972_011273 [Carpinus fangiana]|uniref:ACT domain-containing protein ACR n=1 Tax=Carpinus fangiana TaxID=176857 RepID=A0A660KSV9_9ROSI|nr:hypothetical protein FH972_011273 [Carpinus fangiana]